MVGSSSSSVFAVVSPQFCSPNPVDLIFATELKSGHVAVTDIKGDLIFKVEGRTGFLHGQQVVLDGFGNPVLSMREKLPSLHHRWEVFLGDGAETKHGLLFSVKRNSVIQDVPELDVFLGANTEEEVVDFKVNGNFSDKTFTVSKGSQSSSMVVAQMGEEHEFRKSSAASEKAFRVTVNANMDRSVVAALVIILHELNRRELAEGLAHVVAGVAQVAAEENLKKVIEVLEEAVAASIFI